MFHFFLLPSSPLFGYSSLFIHSSVSLNILLCLDSSGGGLCDPSVDLSGFILNMRKRVDLISEMWRANIYWALPFSVPSSLHLLPVSLAICKQNAHIEHDLTLYVEGLEMLLPLIFVKTFWVSPDLQSNLPNRNVLLAQSRGDLCLICRLLLSLPQISIEETGLFIPLCTQFMPSGLRMQQWRDSKALPSCCTATWVATGKKGSKYLMSCGSKSEWGGEE